MKLELSSRSLRRSALPIAASACLFMAACGSLAGSNPAGSSVAPTFASTPGTAAIQGSAYSYQITVLPAQNAPTMSLSTAPAGAVLTGNSLTWTPSAAQSRLSNQFSVVATNAAGSATQSWNVTPAGPVTGTWVLTYWTSNGAINVPFDISKAPAPLTALIPQPDGSFQTVQGTGTADGTFSISNVPGGYFWLQIGRSAYWTSSSTMDLGLDFNSAAPISAAVNTTTTTMHFNLSGLDPLQAGDEAMFLWDSSPPFTFDSTADSPSGATTLSQSAIINSNIDFSQTAPGFFLQYEPESAGALSTLRLGPAASLPSLSFVNGMSNTVAQALLPSPQNSFDLNVKGSAWTALFSDAGPSSPVLVGSGFEVDVTPSSSMLHGLIPFLTSPLCPVPPTFST
jgi:hypothetical protein